MGMPHAPIQDDEYLGYRIPKNTGVMFNTWSVQPLHSPNTYFIRTDVDRTINMDPMRHPNPRVFDPSRCENDASTAIGSASNPDASKRDHFSFGAGRRLCQGTHIAERSLFLGIARLLWAFKFERERDENGREIIPDIERLTEGAAVLPETFLAKITVRSEEKARVVREQWREAKNNLDGRGQWRDVPDEMKASGYNPVSEKS